MVHRVICPHYFTTRPSLIQLDELHWSFLFDTVSYTTGLKKRTKHLGRETISTPGAHTVEKQGLPVPHAQATP